MSGAPDDDGLDELVAAAEGVAVEIPSADTIKARAARADSLARQAMGPITPVDSGRAMNPRLRLVATEKIKRPATPASRTDTSDR